MDNESPAEEDNDDPSFPCHVNVMIEKKGKGILQIDTTAQDGEIVIDNVVYYNKPELADAKTAELDWKRRNLYEGPPFGNLDEDLQLLLERYLDERGVNTALALWVPEYIDFKEQREYLNWLSSKSFILWSTFSRVKLMILQMSSPSSTLEVPARRTVKT
jgi:complement component 1 Q subcomponent-binding protein